MQLQNDKQTYFIQITTNSHIIFTTVIQVYSQRSLLVFNPEFSLSLAYIQFTCPQFGALQASSQGRFSGSLNSVLSRRVQSGTIQFRLVSSCFDWILYRFVRFERNATRTNISKALQAKHSMHH